ncbi:MAG TPA: GntR family transcriptional regulator [Gaiella sp.]|nr:GntR family transcriptional regulator [Gaiella sp.]
MTAVHEDGRALVDRLAKAIGTRVLAGEIPSGARLRQEALASEFGVSRTPVREALRMLQASGIVEMHPNRGAVVRRPAVREVREAYEVRAELEGLAAELAASRVEEPQLRCLREAEAMFRSSCTTLIDRRRRREDATPWSDDIREWMQANDVFHRSVHEAAGNERLRGTIVELHLNFPRNLTSIVLSGSSRLLAENVEQHAAIVGAIEVGDGADARRQMVAHIRRTGELVTHRFEAEGGS